jgi:Cu+-exporting ATPase
MGDQNTIQFSGSHGGRLEIITIVVLAVAVIAGAAGLVLRARITANAAIVATVATERVLVGIEGMHCTSCASGIKSMLKRTRGVVSADVSFNQKEANVEFDPSATSREKIIEAINNMGYKAHVKG